MIEKGACVGVWMCGRVTNCFVYLSTMVNINANVFGMCLPGVPYLGTQVHSSERSVSIWLL